MRFGSPDQRAGCGGHPVRGLASAGRALILPGLIAMSLSLSGCVGGPGSYFESVSREKQSNAAKAEDAAVPDLQVAAVESAELAAPGENTAQNDVEAPPVKANDLVALSGNAIQSGSQNEALLASDGLTSPALEAGAPVQIGLVEGDNGDLLLLPAPSDTTNSYPDQPQGTSADTPNAYANPQPVVNLQNPALASLLPGADGSMPNNDTGFAIGSETPPVIDPLEAAAQSRIPLLHASIDHGQCKGGFGPKPKKIGAKRINSGDPYYIEIRMRQTPLLPVGHTYVAYGRLGADGEPLDERLIMLAPVGGYAGAALASGIPMPGILTPHRDDCRIRPDVGYRVSLNAQRYEQLLREVQKAKAEKPSYLLLAYNCNHFMTRIAGSVGILPPNNIYLPAVQYLYAMIERNEGIRVSRF